MPDAELHVIRQNLHVMHITLRFSLLVCKSFVSEYSSLRMHCLTKIVPRTNSLRQTGKDVALVMGVCSSHMLVLVS